MSDLLLSWVLQNAAVAAILAVVVLALCRLWKGRPAIEHVLWLLVLIKLITPPLLHWPWELPASLGSIERRSMGEAVEGIEAESFYVIVPSSGVETSREIAASDATSETVTAATAVASPSAGLGRFALGLWLVGSILLAGVEVLRIVRLQRVVSRAMPAPPRIVSLVRELALGLGAPVPATRVANGIGSPLVWSLGKPKLLLPAPLLARVDEDSLRSMVAHELAHLTRRDHWIGWLELAGELVWWWNPVYWLARRKLRDCSELCCDAWVVWALPQARRAYADALIEVCKLVSEGRAPVPALGLRSDTRRTFLKRRLTMILLESTSRRIPLAGIAAAALLACAVLPGWSQESNDYGVLPIDPPADEVGIPDEAAPAPVVIPGLPPAPAPAPLPARPARLPQPAQPAAPPVVAPPVLGLPGSPGGVPAPFPEGGPNQSSPDPRKTPTVSPPGSRTGGMSDAPDRIAELEKRLRKLTNEVERLRSEKRANIPALPPMAGTLGAGGGITAIGPAPPLAGRAPHVGGPMLLLPGTASDDGFVGQSTVLIRTKYKLPHEKAQALASFLVEHVDGDVDVVVKDDSLVITSSEATNAAVGQLIAVMARKAHKSAPTGAGAPPGFGTASGGAGIKP